jgi:hypothetical protein
VVNEYPRGGQYGDGEVGSPLYSNMPSENNKGMSYQMIHKTPISGKSSFKLKRVPNNSRPGLNTQVSVKKLEFGHENTGSKQ